MAVRSDRPYPSVDFRVWLGAGDDGSLGFCRVEFPDFPAACGSGVDTALAPYRSTLLLQRGFDGQLTVYAWWHRARDTKRLRGKTVRIELLGPRRRAVATWIFSGCRPVRLAYSPLDALASTVLMESLELSFEQMAME